MQQIEKTINEVEKLNPDLARELRRYVRDHSYGLVYEQNLPENVRLYTKKAAVGDSVNIRPPRGSNETEENKVVWKVCSINPDGTAEIMRGEEKRQIAAEDLVPVVSWKDTIYPGLKEVDRIERGDPNDPYQVVINAENYHALEMLLYCYPGKVDCIYIDPPYNTGAKDWKYNNNYVDGTDQYRHSKWLSFMERRLKLAKRLLNPNNSVLIVTIDEKEQTRLGLLLEQLFPEARIQMITDVINPSGSPRKHMFSRAEEYIYFVFFGEAAVIPIQTDMLHPREKEKNVRWASLLRSGSNSAREDRPKLFYPLYFSKDTGKLLDIGQPIPLEKNKEDIPVPENCFVVWPIKDNGKDGRWQLQPDTLKEKIEMGHFKYGPWKKGQTYRTISYFSTGLENALKKGELQILGRNEDGSLITGISQQSVPPLTVWNQSSHGAGDNGSSFLLEIFNEKRFSFPKSYSSVFDTLKFVVGNNKEAIILDFFAGSGTTLHAVNLLNAEDDGHRRCICITNNEVSADETKILTAQKLRQGDAEWESRGIAHYVTWPRTKCSIQGVDINNNPMKGKYLNVETMRAEGFKANAIFFNLTYESLLPICLDSAFDAISPILWMQSGCLGPIIRRTGKSYLTTPYYAVLFDYNQASKFCQKVKNTSTIHHAYVVTDDQRRYSNICKRLPGISVHRLYESYIKTFEICAEGGLDL